MDGPPLELKYDVMGPLKLDGPPFELKHVVMGPRFCDLQKKKVFTEISTVFVAEIK